MLIRKAKTEDKIHILNFCKNTFSWGDYIDDVWDYWLNDGTLLVIEKDVPIGVSHGVFSQNQLWIEGIRINRDFRRQGLASNLIRELETLAVKKQIPVSLMLIDTENSPSLQMAKNLGYKIFQTWNFYSLLPIKKNIDDISFGNIIQDNQFPHFVKSWRWLPLTKEELTYLDSENYIIYSKKDQNQTMAILQDSEHFEKTLIVTLFAGSTINTSNVMLFLQNFGFEKKYKRIQILTKEILPENKNLEHKISFYLMQKLLS